MKNTNRYKLVPVLIIGLVLSTFSVMAEVKTVVAKSGTKATIEIKESEVGTCVFWTMADNNTFRQTYLTIRAGGREFTLQASTSLEILNRYPNFKIAGPAEIVLESGGILSMEIKPNEKH
jgi:hypothetical protein